MEVFQGKEGIQSAELERTKTRQKRLTILRWRSGVKTGVSQFFPESLAFAAVYSYDITTAASAVALALDTRYSSCCYCSL